MSVSKQHIVQNMKCTELLDVVVSNPSFSYLFSFYAKGGARHIASSAYRDHRGKPKLFPMIKSSICFQPK